MVAEPGASRHNATMNLAMRIRSIQIVYVAMAIAPVLLGIAALLGTPDGIAGRNADTERVMTIAFAAMTVMLLGLSFFPPGRIHAGPQGQSLVTRLLAYQRTKILTAALCEVPTFMWAVLLYLSGNIWYALPMALCLTAMLTRFPTVMEVEALIGKRAQEIDRELVGR